MVLLLGDWVAVCTIENASVQHRKESSEGQAVSLADMCQGVQSSLNFKSQVYVVDCNSILETRPWSRLRREFSSLICSNHFHPAHAFPPYFFESISIYYKKNDLMFRFLRRARKGRTAKKRRGPALAQQQISQWPSPTTLYHQHAYPLRGKIIPFNLSAV